jgi:hypothetical protein
VVGFRHLPLYSRGKRPRHQLDRRLGGPQSWSRLCGEVNFFILSGVDNIKNVRLSGLEIRPLDLRHVASRYTDCATLAIKSVVELKKNVRIYQN